MKSQFKPTSGEASVFGFDVVRRDAEVRKVISYVPQETSVWADISGFENLLIYAKIYGLPSRDRNKVIRDALEGMGLDTVTDNLVNDIIINNSELSVVVVDAETALPVVMEILRNWGISVKKISMTRPTLDDVFLKYAGKG